MATSEQAPGGAVPRQGMKPLVTVGLPTYNREMSLPKVLESLLALDYDKKRLRVCFVDNGSTDRTMEIVSSFTTSHGAEYESVEVSTLRSNIPEARNHILSMARGTDFVFFLDSDVVPPRDTLDRLLSCFKPEGKVGMAAIPCDNKNARKRAGILFRAFAVPYGPHEAYKVATCCTLASMEACDRVGGFNVKLRVHEDSEYCFRMRKAGFKVISDSSLEGEHLKDIRVDASFYWRFMNDSAATYRELIARGSALHSAKAALSYLLVASFASVLLFPGLPALGGFLAVLAAAAWLNSSAAALDDGAHARIGYRPIIGLLFTATTLVVCLLLIPAAARRP